MVYPRQRYCVSIIDTLSLSATMYNDRIDQRADPLTCYWPHPPFRLFEMYFEIFFVFIP